jgi:hypothetical protein
MIPLVTYWRCPAMTKTHRIWSKNRIALMRTQIVRIVVVIDSFSWNKQYKKTLKFFMRDTWKTLPVKIAYEIISSYFCHEFTLVLQSTIRECQTHKYHFSYWSCLRLSSQTSIGPCVFGFAHTGTKDDTFCFDHQQKRTDEKSVAIVGFSAAEIGI